MRIRPLFVLRLCCSYFLRIFAVYFSKYIAMRLIADSGSTKTDWCVVDDGMEICRVTGQGINPFQQDEETIRDIIHNDVVHLLKDVYLIDEICFYGAGCRDRMICVLEKLLSNAFDKADRIEVCSDMLGAARALFGGSEGIACILGTGSNSCLYDGKRITANVPPLGYILGDEGSGAVLGRLFVNALFKGLLPDEIRYRFQEETGYDQAYIINKVYREPMANRFLAGLSVFIHKHLDNKEMKDLVIRNFKNFFKHNVMMYRRQDLPVSAVGSIAFYYKEELEEAAMSLGYKLVNVMKSPMDGLIKF